MIVKRVVRLTPWRERATSTKKMQSPSGDSAPGEKASPTEVSSATGHEPSPRHYVSTAVASTGSLSVRCILVLLFIWGLIYVPGLASPPMMDDADSEHAVIAREMLQRRDFVTMHVNGIRYLDKAPLPYWIMAGSYRLFGVSEFSARLEFSLFALFTMLAIFALGHEISGELTG